MSKKDVQTTAVTPLFDESSDEKLAEQDSSSDQQASTEFSDQTSVSDQASVEQPESIPVVRVMGVPEHFNYSWTIGQEMGFFEKFGVKVEFVVAPGGTGAMIAALKRGDVDMVVALTEGLVADIAKGSDLRLIGTYVHSKLCWAVSTGADSSFNSVQDLKNQTFAVSRYTSGSHLMSYLLAKEQGWNPQTDIDFKVVGAIQNLLASVNSKETAAFMWETFTTKPYHDAKVVRRIGEITTPWPCFMMASKQDVLRDKGDAIRAVQSGIKLACAYFNSQVNLMPDLIAKTYDLKLEDAQKWYNGVQVFGVPEISRRAIEDAINVLREVKVLDGSPVDIEQMAESCRLI